MATQKRNQELVSILSVDFLRNLLGAVVDGNLKEVYALLAGRSGGQTLNGGTAASETLTLSSTAHATKGKMILGTASAYDEANDRLGIGTTTPSYTIEALKSIADYVAKFRNTNGTSAGNGLWVDTRWNVAANIILRVTTNQGTIEVLACMGDGKVGLGTTSPTASLDIPASTTNNASIRIRSGTAPSSPNSGDLWYDGTNLKFRDGATTRTITWV